MEDKEIGFSHRQSAHCENGVISNLFRHHGLEMSEPMAFGIGSGLFFAHIPFAKVNGIPGTSYRIWPGLIFQRASKLLGVKMYMKQFRNPEDSMKMLDESLASGKPVGLVTSVYYLPYLPEAFRFHFNAHNIVVYGRQGDEYLVSDPVIEHVTRISREDLMRARYAKGIPEPSGKMYYPIEIPKEVDWKAAILKGVRRASFDITQIPLPWFGTKGIRFLAKRLAIYPESVGDRRSILYLGNIIRMQEEIGTGGAGFRFVYSAFLQESGKLLGYDWLLEASQKLTETGDHWRAFAFDAGRLCKKRQSDYVSFKALSEMLVKLSYEEEQIFTELYHRSKQSLQ